MKRPAKHFWIICGICALCTGLAVWLFAGEVSLMVDAENYTQDLRMRQGRKTPFDDRLVLIGVDRAAYADYFSEAEMQATPALRAISEPYPWSREVWAALITKLADAGVKTIVIDLVFAAPKTGDDALAAALDKYRDRVVIGYAFDLTRTEQKKFGSLTLPSETVIAASAEHSVVEDDRLGYVTIWPDDDDVLRKAHYRHTGDEVGDVLAPSVTMESLAARAVRKFGRADLIPSGTNPRRFRYTAPGGTYKPILIGDVLLPTTWEHNYGNGAFFKDKLVLIGPTASVMQDKHTTPLGDMPGPEIHLNIINAALHGEFLRETSPRVSLLVLGLAGFLAAALCFIFREPVKRLLVVFGLCAGYWFLAKYLFAHAGVFIPAAAPLLILPVAAPLLVLFVGSVVVLSFDFLLERLDKVRVRKTLERYVSRNVVKELLDNPQTYFNSLTGVRKPVTILFSDVRGFTTLTESADSAALVKQLNEYFEEMVKLVFAHEGSLDKFIGDAVMAVWGNIVSKSPAHDAKQAVATALAMRQSLGRLNEDWKTRGMIEIHIGIGINHGEVIVGNLGSTEKMELTVIGDAVNLASRLEGLTKEYHLDLLLGENVAKLVSDIYILRLVDCVQVKGKTKPVDVFTVMGEGAGQTVSLPLWLARYEEGVRRYREREFAAAAKLFAESVRVKPDDYLSAMYLKRCEELVKNPPDESWDGVFVMTKEINPLPMQNTTEHQRLREGADQPVPPWRKWGTYVADRAWGTVREDYSENGEAWDFFTHDQARSKAYRWGEDGIAGWCDRYQRLVLGWAFWNGRDPILKERLFGLVPREGNHGEDVKEYYFHLDATPSHSYQKFLYKYPQAEYPYARLIAENQQRTSRDREFELLDTGIFDDDRYFDIFIEYAKARPEDLCVRVEICNRGPVAAPIHVLPHLWFRNNWSWTSPPTGKPSIALGKPGEKFVTLETDDSAMPPVRNLPFDYKLGPRFFLGEAGATPLFTENETNCERIFGAAMKSASPFVKDAFHRHVINGEACVNPQPTGTKAALHYAAKVVPAGGSIVLHFRLTNEKLADPLADVDKIISQRRAEADEFYATIHPPQATADEKRVQRAALAGLIWSKQSYLFSVHKWLTGDNPDWPPPESRWSIRNQHWQHISSQRVMTMPDKWEYPWFAAWDLAFQCVPFALVDPVFAKEQLWLLLFEQFQHPSGQIPAYEWEFSDLNPPVHAWAIWRVFNMDRIGSGQADRLFLEKCFHKLLMNFAWWVNRVDAEGNNLFEGGFLGLDNITLIDRSLKSKDGAKLQQSDATGWMGMFCLNMMRIALELAKENKAYEGLAFKFFEHFLYIGAAMKNRGGKGYELWDEEDGFFYDVLEFPDGSFHKFRVRSLVGLIPLFAIERLEECWMQPFPEFTKNFHWLIKNRPDLADHCVSTLSVDGQTVHVLAVMPPEQMRATLARVWDAGEFRSDHGLRSLSKFHEQHPVSYEGSIVRYEPGESVEKLKGGNSNWRGPVWLPMNFMMIESLRKLRKAYGDDFTVPAANGHESAVTLDEMAHGFADRIVKTFTRDGKNGRAIYGQQSKFQTDPHWRDLLLFHEYFHGDTGEGLGSSHQTGWTSLVASLIDEWRK